MICNNCGKELKEGAKFCGYCGTKTEQKIENGQPKENISKKQKENKKKKTVIIISCILLTIALIVGILVYFNNKEERNINIEESYQNSGNNEDIIMYEWKNFYATQEERNTMSGAEVNEKYEYILYDSENRELVYQNGNGTMIYYQMYEEIDKNTYKVYKLISNGMLIEPYHEEISIITPDGNRHIKNEEITSDQVIDYEEYKQLEEKYIEYIDKHKDHRKEGITILDNSVKNDAIQEEIKEYAIQKIESQEKEPDDIRFSEAQIIEKDKENKYLVLVHYTCYMAFWNGEYVNEEKDFYDLVIVKTDNSGNPYIDELYWYQGITEEFKSIDNDISKVSVLSEEIKAENNWKY